LVILQEIAANLSSDKNKKTAAIDTGIQKKCSETWTLLDQEAKNEWKEKATNTLNNSDKKKNKILVSNSQCFNLVNSELTKIQEIVNLFIVFIHFLFVYLLYYLPT
jgi:hypothetical protein